MRPGASRVACAAGLAAATALVAVAQPSIRRPDFRLRPVAVVTTHLEEGILRWPAGVFFDGAASELWIADARSHLLGVFTRDGVPLYATAGGGAIHEPESVTVGPEGDLWVLDGDRSRIARLDWRGSPLPTPELPGLPAEPVIGAIAFDGGGRLWVGETGEGRVHVFDRDLEPSFRFGSRGRDREQFLAIVDLEIVGDVVLVVDAVGWAVQEFNLRGELQRAWGEHVLGADGFSLPQAATVDSRGRIVVVDALRHEIKFFDPEGRFITRFGGLGSRPGQVRAPADVAIDSEDRLYVADKGNGRVQILAIEPVER